MLSVDKILSDLNLSRRETHFNASNYLAARLGSI